MPSTRLTIFLLRDVDTPDDALVGDKPTTAVGLDPNTGLDGSFYYSSRPSTPPRWVSFVEPIVEGTLTNLRSSSASGLLVIKSSERYFALTFGYGRSFIDPSKIERQFGLRVALNRIDPSQIRSMDTKVFEDMVVTRNTQTSRSTDLPSFGVDVSRDILRAVTGQPRDKSFAKRLSGSDALVVNLEIDPKDIPAKCAEFFEAFEDDVYKENFEWIDQLAIVEDKVKVGALNDQMVIQLQAGDASSTHMAMPEAIDWEDVDTFRIGGTRKVEYEDLDLDDYFRELGAETSDITLDILKSRPVSVRFGRSSDFESRWNIYQCLISEQTLGPDLFVLIEGRWFSVSSSLVTEVDAFVGALGSSTATLPTSLPKETEPDYNRRVATADPDMFLHLDAKIKRPGGAASGIEVCDLFASTGEFVHVKRKSRSSTLSHLFAQGTVSATTFLGDASFRDEIRGHVESTTTGSRRQAWLDRLPEPGRTPDRSKYHVAYVVLADSSKPGVEWLPFFSKLNLMQHGKQLRNLGLDVSLTRIGSI